MGIHEPDNLMNQPSLLQVFHEALPLSLLDLLRELRPLLLRLFESAEMLLRYPSRLGQACRPFFPGKDGPSTGIRRME